MSLGCDYSHPLWAIYAVKWPNQCGYWLFYGRIRVCYIHIGVGSALLVLLLMAMRRPRCAGQANDQFPRFFYAVTWSFVLYPSCRGTQDTWKTLGDGNILFFTEYRYLLYLLWHYYYSGDNDIPLCLTEMYWRRYCSYHSFLSNRFCFIYSSFCSNVLNDRCYGSWR